MGRLTLVGLMLWSSVVAFGQQGPVTPAFSEPQSIPGVFTDFTTDNLGNVYLVTPGNQVKKINEKGDSLGVYNDVRRYGRISMVDATNPLKILVYYRDYSSVIVLDRFLNRRNVLDLRQQNLLQVKTIATAYDNNYWVYDEMDSRLRRLDDNANVLMESADLRQAFPLAPAPVSIFDRDGQLYLYDTTQGMFIFDYYGAKKNLLAIPHLHDVQVIHKNLITGRDSNGIIVYKPGTMQLESLPFPSQNHAFVKVHFNGNKLFVLQNDGRLEIFTLLR